MTSQNTGGLSPSRRTLVKGAAWSVPVIAIAAPAQALTCSPLSCPPTVDFTGAACKLPGASQDLFKGYRFELEVTNTSNTDLVVVITSVTVAGVTEPSYAVNVVQGTACACATCAVGGQCVTAGQSITLHVDTENPSGNSQNTEFTVVYSVYECDAECTFVLSASASSGSLNTPPIQGAQCTLCCGA
ncbi:hypothetical protein [Ornithinimicrobium cerasi]|uniref:hypothetical protein n=1 Tax=Ornithinimicrobium cerasi TaxID=2248773 RepID=UPI000EFEBABF|nr:hypothetical protein [Ornithinimicrobium cerasi]